MVTASTVRTVPDRGAVVTARRGATGREESEMDKTGRRAVLAAGTAVLGASLVVTTQATASSSLYLTDVAANTKTVGYSAPNVLSPELSEVIWAQGSTALENPTPAIANYGYDADGPFVALPSTSAEAHKTEPDKNTYLVLKDQGGPDAGYDYGSHFLFQGHETGNAGYITRINLDADPKHRVTLYSTTDSTGAALPTFDGSTYDPFTKSLIFTTESRKSSGAYEVGLPFTGTGVQARSLVGSLGRAAYEGVQVDSDGNLWLVEDATGSLVLGAKQPNSYLYRFVPTTKGDLSKGVLQALQIKDTSGKPIAVDSATPLTAQIAQRYAYGTTLSTAWVTVHDTAKDGTSAFDAFALAGGAGATPLKRPENGVFRPGSDFREFYYTETGDTSAISTADPENNPTKTNYGGYGGIFRIAQKSPSASTGTVSLVYTGDKFHAGFDNIAFLDRNRALIVEDAGDTLHSQRQKLDSGYALDVTRDWSKGDQPTRFLAEGRDASATLDSAFQGTDGFVNEGDNEITGIHVSDGDPSVSGLLGAEVPSPFEDGWRIFWTQQHGDNVTYEVIPAPFGH
jgi:hypothetical protein